MYDENHLNKKNINKNKKINKVFLKCKVAVVLVCFCPSCVEIRKGVVHLRLRCVMHQTWMTM